MSLQSSAMLVGVTLKLGGLLGERRDAGASAMVAEKYSAAEKTCKASKYLINRQHKAVKAVQAAAQRIRDCGYNTRFRGAIAGCVCFLSKPRAPIARKSMRQS